MARNFRELREKMPPAAQAASAARAEQLRAEMPLHELRAARALTQQTLAKNLRISQAAVSRLERRADVYVSTLRNFVRAVGGELEIVARFPDGSVQVMGFDEPHHDFETENVPPPSRSS
jgi:DNA-binding XRE family transcriptional regulator